MDFCYVFSSLPIGPRIVDQGLFDTDRYHITSPEPVIG